VLLLFDVDGTLLLRAAEAHKRAFHQALHEVFGIEDPRALRVSTPGKTDLQIAREVLLLAGFDRRTIDERMDDLSDAWVEAHAELEVDLDHTVAPGMRELLQALDGHDEARLSLVTGNLEPIARLKLTRARIGDFFPRGQGGFGSDSEDRTELPGIARRRAGSRDQPYPPERTAVIGDTPLDIACARADGVKAIAVASGPFGVNELGAADHIASDTVELRAVLERLL
jgi:phosphoglycolate phosphatase-like HAD superfamily hydrolase